MMNACVHEITSKKAKRTMQVDSVINVNMGEKWP